MQGVHHYSVFTPFTIIIKHPNIITSIYPYQNVYVKQISIKYGVVTVPMAGFGGNVDSGTVVVARCLHSG